MTAMLSACGQIGPLYMPRVPADPDAPPPSATDTQSAIRQNQQQRMPLPGSNMSTAPGASQSSPSYNPGPFSR